MLTGNTGISRSTRRDAECRIITHRCIYERARGASCTQTDYQRVHTIIGRAGGRGGATTLRSAPAAAL